MFLFQRATMADESTLQQIFKESILGISASYYTDTQLSQWAAVANNATYWRNLAETQYCIIGSYQAIPAGYASLTENGFVDHLYVSTPFQRKGLGSALLQQIEIHAKRLNITQLETDASLVAAPVFKKMGYQIVKEYTKLFSGESYHNSILIKLLA